MESKAVAYVNKPVTKVILGTSSKCFWSGENCDGLLNAALAAGVTTLDTARGYGKSEEVIGDWLERTVGAREKVLVQTKGGLHGLLGNNRVNEKCIRDDLIRSLRALRTDKIDLYLLHRDDERTEAGAILSFLNDLKAEGKIGAFGASNWTGKRIEQANEYAYKYGLQPFSVSETQYSLSEVTRWTWLGCKTVTGERNTDDLAWYKKTGFPLMAYSPLGGGYLSGKLTSEQIKKGAKLPPNAKAYTGKDNLERLRRCEELARERNVTVAQIALSYLLCSAVNAFVIVGSSNEKGLNENVAAIKIKLNENQLKYLNLEE